MSKQSITDLAIAKHGRVEFDAAFHYALGGWDRDEAYTPAMIASDLLDVSSDAEIEAMITALGWYGWTQALYYDVVNASFYASEDRFGSWESGTYYDKRSS